MQLPSSSLVLLIFLSIIDASSVPRKDALSSSSTRASHFERRNHPLLLQRREEKVNPKGGIYEKSVEAASHLAIQQAEMYRGQICGWCMKECVKDTKSPRTTPDCEVDCTEALNTAMEAEGYLPIIHALLDNKLLDSYQCTAHDVHSPVQAAPWNNPMGQGMVVPPPANPAEANQERSRRSDELQVVGANGGKRRVIRKKTKSPLNFEGGAGGSQEQGFSAWFQQSGAAVRNEAKKAWKNIGQNWQRVEQGKVPFSPFMPSSPSSKVALPGGVKVPVPAMPALRMVP